MSFDRLTGHDLGIRTRLGPLPSERPNVAYVQRPHPSPAMERALQLIDEWRLPPLPTETRKTDEPEA
jgi:hypothetical protein